MKKLVSLITAAAITVGIAETSRAAEIVSNRDAKFIRKAAEGNHAEIQMARVVAQRTQDPQLRAYAGKVVCDRSRANRELQRIAYVKGVDFPTSPTRSDEQTMRNLEELSGPRFDRGVIDHWVTDHNIDIRQYHSEAKHAHDPQLQQYALSSLPVLHEHLNDAEALSAHGMTREPAGASH